LLLLNGFGSNGRIARPSSPALERGKLLQLMLDRSGTRKHAPFDFVETIVGRVKHEAARYAHGDSDGPSIELHGKSLADQALHSSGPRDACAGQRRASVTQVCFLGRPLTGSCRLGAKGPEQSWGVPALRALESCGAATRMERKARKLKVLSHVGTVAHWQV